MSLCWRVNEAVGFLRKIGRFLASRATIDGMNATETIPTELVVTVAEKIEGRRTVWKVTCPDGCDEVKNVNPVSRERGTWFAMDHVNNKHKGFGSIKVMRARGDRRKRR